MYRRLLTALLVGALVGTAVGPVGATAGGRRTFIGTIDGADYRVETPDRWNGTLVLFSHGNWPAAGPPPPQGVWLANRPPDRSATERWLLAHGYALAASNFKGITGYQVENALHDQIALLDWFAEHVGRPRRTIATGHSNGAVISALLVERHPDRFAGVATFCSEFDANGTLNAALDMLFTVRTLLVDPATDVDLVRPRDPRGSTDILTQAIERARATPQGRARIALAAAFGNLPGWFSAHLPRPTDPDEWINHQATWLQGYAYFAGPVERVDVERRAGGNPSFNVGVDYRRQLVRSDQTGRVREAYRAAGLDLGADLARLAAAPRIAADPAAEAYLHRFGVPRGRTPVPIISLHTGADGGAVADHERWYAERVRRNGDPRQLRQVYADRGMHCAFSDAEEITVLRSLVRRIDTGRWPDLSPRQLNAAARELGDAYQLVLDFPTFQDAPMPPAFFRFVPPEPTRPSTDPGILQRP